MDADQRNELERLLVDAVITALKASDGKPSAATMKLGLSLLIATDSGTLRPRQTPEEMRKASAASLSASLAKRGRSLPFAVPSPNKADGQLSPGTRPSEDQSHAAL